MIKAVVFDLDDTLIAETEYVKSGFRAIGRTLDDDKMADKLWKLFEEDKKDVYQRAGFSEEECKHCIEIYRSHKPDIVLSRATESFLYTLKSQGIKLGIITDGRPTGQWNKIYALGLDKIMDKIIVTDELGGEEFRKPNPKSFEIMREALSVEFEEMMYVGDNPAKDFYIGSVYPITTVRFISDSIWREKEYFLGIKEYIAIKSITEISRLLEREQKYENRNNNLS